MPDMIKFIRPQSTSAGGLAQHRGEMVKLKATRVRLPKPHSDMVSPPSRPDDGSPINR
ncbi:hypothetical protein KCMC57_up58570 [Kitasatospora sp. CMC57]|uniref:Uncharacterized protein n=1 Tax=Kitasatospora sp. CMC57 TaxID=3231513 RepID=A0AB33K1Y1_9ACTN